MLRRMEIPRLRDFLSKFGMKLTTVALGHYMFTAVVANLSVKKMTLASAIFVQAIISNLKLEKLPYVRFLSPSKCST